MTRSEAIGLLKRHNRESFLIKHALTVEKVMRWFANDLGFPQESDLWAMAGLLHDIDYGEYPDRHCEVTPDILRDAGFGEDFIRSVISHGWGMCKGSPMPERLMEKVLFAVDELTGLIGAAALMRPSGSVQDMELKSLKKKFKDKSFAAGCSRETISRGAELLGWDLDVLLGKTLEAMKDSESDLKKEMAESL